MHENYILTLGFRGDSYSLAEEVRDVVKENCLELIVKGFRSRSELKFWLDEYALEIPDGKSFDPNTGQESFPAAGTQNSKYEKWVQEHPCWLKEWKPYKSENIKLFVCSTVTRDDTDEYAMTVYDGEKFAKSILPETPLLILHFKNKFKGSIQIPNEETLKIGLRNKVYHLLRDVTNVERAEVSSEAMKSLIKELFEYKMEIPLERYQQIINSIQL